MNQSPKLLSLKVEKELEKAIRQKKYHVGDKLPTENQLCKMFSVSRTAVREALKSLKARGLVTIRKGSGAYVSELSVKNAVGPINLYFELTKNEDLVAHAIKTRLLFEPEIAGLAALNRTPEHLTFFEDNLKALTNCPTEDIQLETELDIAFHTLVTQSTGNPVISLIMEPVLNLISRYKPIIFGKHSSLDRDEIKASVIKFHTRIFQAIKNEDSREAYYQMKEHLLTTERNSLKASQIKDEN